MENNKKNQIVETARSFVLAHPFLTYFIADGLIGMVKSVVNSITYSSSYKAYVKEFAGRAQDMAAPKNFNTWKKEEENTDEEKDTADSNDDSDVSDIFSNDTGSADRGDDDLHG